jgi:hypothetical protein
MHQGAGQPKAGAKAKPTDPLQSGFFDGMNESAREAWRAFSDGGRYRIAGPDDFGFSDREKIKFGLFRENERPLLGGNDINHDNVWNDYAAIVVDTTRSDPNRFGLAIFNAPKNGSGYKQYWLYRNEDLSRTVISWASTELFVTRVQGDGSQETCIVKWDSSSRSYSCLKSRSRRGPKSATRGQA